MNTNTNTNKQPTSIAPIPLDVKLCLHKICKQATANMHDHMYVCIDNRKTMCLPRIDMTSSKTNAIVVMTVVDCRTMEQAEITIDAVLDVRLFGDLNVTDILGELDRLIREDYSPLISQLAAIRKQYLTDLDAYKHCDVTC